MGLFCIDVDLLLSSLRDDPENFVALLKAEMAKVEEMFQVGKERSVALLDYAKRNRDLAWKLAKEYDKWCGDEENVAVRALQETRAEFLFEDVHYSQRKEKEYNGSRSSALFFGGVVSCLWVLFAVILVTHANAYDYFLWMPAHRIFRMFILLSLYVFSLAVDAGIFSTFFWTFCVTLSFRDLTAISFQICSITLALTCVYLIHGRGDLDRERAADYWLVVLVGVQLLYLVNPFPVLYRSARMRLLRTLGRIIFSPFSSPNFFDVWLADQFCSLIVILSDFGYTLCYFVADVGRSTDVCTTGIDPWLRSALACVPFWFRLMQSARRFRDEGSGHFHMANAGKYFLSLCVAAFATLHALSDQFTGKWDAFRILWLIFGVSATLASSFWDAIMDFDGVKDSGYFPKWHFGVAVVTNSLLRCAWLFTVAPLPFAGFMYDRILEFSLGSAEILRRAQWNAYRVASEHVKMMKEKQRTRTRQHLN